MKKSRTPRRQRKGAADDLAGVRYQGRSLVLPKWTLDTWMVARRIPGYHRGGFRAWLKAEANKRHRPGKWDERCEQYRSAEL